MYPKQISQLKNDRRKALEFALCDLAVIWQGEGSQRVREAVYDYPELFNKLSEVVRLHFDLYAKRDVREEVV